MKGDKMKPWYDDIDVATLQRIKTYSAFCDYKSQNLMLQTLYEAMQKKIDEYKKTNREIAKDYADLQKQVPQWHDLRKDPNDLPKEELEEKQLLVRVRNYTEDCIFAYYMLDKYYSKNGKRFYSDIDCDYPIDIKDVIAWKEIELPELKEDEIEMAERRYKENG